MLRQNSRIWGKVIAIEIVLAMLFSTGFALTETAAAEPVEQADDLTPPYPPFMVWGTIYDESNTPVLNAIVTVTNLMTGESLDADVYENGAYDTELENLQYGYSISDEIEITAIVGENTASKTIVVKQLGFGERIDIHFGNGINSIQSENLLVSGFESQDESPKFNMVADYERQPMPARPQDSSGNPNTIYIDSPVSTTNEPEPEISLVDIRMPPYFRLAFTEKENNIRMTMKNSGSEKRIIIVDLYHVEPDGITESFLKTVHFGAIQSGQTKTTDAFGNNDDMWTPTERGRNWIRGEIYIKGHGNDRILVNNFRESFWIVPGWRPILELGTTVITEPTTWDNFTVIIDGDLYVNAPLDIVNADVIGDDLVVTDEYSIHAGSSHNMACPEDGQYKVEVNPDGTLNIWDALTNDPDDNHYWFYMNGTLNVGRELPIFKPGIVENVMGSPDLSQPGGIICTTDNVRIENGAEVRYGKTHGVWLQGSDAVISGAKVHDNGIVGIGGDGIVCVAGSAPTIEGCNISWNTRYGIRAEGSIPIIRNNNLVQYNRNHGIFVNDVWSDRAVIDHNTISDNFASGIYATNTNIPITDNTISSNGLDPVFEDDFEIDTGMWTADGLWHWVSNESGAAPAWNLSHSGDWSYWYGQDSTGDYNTGGINNGSLTSEDLDLPNEIPVTLSFYSWYETDANPGTDQRWVIIKTNDNESKIRLLGEENRTWVKYAIDISEFADLIINITFYFDTITAFNNTFQGWYIDDVEILAPNNEGYGIYCRNMNGTIDNNIIDSNRWGIFCDDTHNITIHNNTVVANRDSGILLVNNASGTLIRDNNCSSNSDVGVYIEESSGSRNTIIHNNLTNNRDGVRLLDCANITIDTNNVSNNTQCGIHIHGSGNDINIVNNMIWGNGLQGLNIIGTHNIIDNNSFQYNYIGICLATSIGCIITNNTISYNELDGIQVRGVSHNNSIKNNTIMSNSYWGIWLDGSFSVPGGSSNNKVTNNTLSGNKAGIYLVEENNDFIKGNRISNSTWGIVLYKYPRNNSIIDNNISDNLFGFYIFLVGPGHSNTICNNTLYRNTEAGIFLDSSVGINLVENRMKVCGIVIWGDMLEHWNTHSIGTSNTVNDKPVYYWKNATGGTIPLGAGQVILANSTNINVVGLNISNGSVGIELGFSFNNLIEDNTMFRNNRGILLFNSSNNRILNNYISSNTKEGIYLHLSNSNIIEKNTIHSNSLSIFLYTSSSNSIINNNASNNYYGIYLFYSGGNNITNSNASNNVFGIIFYSSYGNLIHHNNFINNTNQAYDDSTNQWDNGYPFGGNYWSDYTGIDAMSGPDQNLPGSDGLGDTAYTGIQGGTGAQDDYPLMAIPSFGIFSIPVTLGWNLISIPFACSGFPPDVLRDITGDTEWNVVRWYDSQDTDDPWKIHRIDGVANDLFNINYTMGLWVYITSIGDGFLTLEGRIPAITSIQLYTGWNLIGYPTFTEKTVANAFWGTGADHVEVFNASSPTLLSEVGSTYLMKPGEGYWVHVPADSVWTVEW